MNIARRALCMVFVGIALVGCAPRQTTTTTTVPVDSELQAEKEYSSGFEYYKQGNYENAILHFTEAIRLNMNYYAAYIALAKAHRANRHGVAAESTYSVAKRMRATDPRAYEGLGALYAEQKRYKEAYAEYTGGLALDSTNVNLLNGLGFVYTRTGEYGKALDSYTKSLTYEPENLNTMFAVASLFIVKGELDSALNYLQEIVRKRPDNLDVREKLAETLTELGRYDEALKEYESLLAQEPNTSELYLKSGQIYERQKKPSLALKQYEQARILEPHSPLPLLCMAELKITQAQYNEAERLVKEAVTLDTDNLHAQVLFGDIYLKRGDNAKASWDRNKNRDNCPTLRSAIGYLQTAISYYNKVKTDEVYSTYATKEIDWCTSLIKALDEDTWFYCK